MHIGVIGAGVVGLTTANALAQRAHSVTLFEAEAQPASQTSFANGAQLSYSFTDPLASPELLSALPRILLGQSPGIRIRHKADLSYLTWAARFLWNCLPQNQRRNAKSLESLAARSSKLMQSFHKASDLNYFHRNNGKLVLLAAPPGGSLLAGIERKRARGMQIEVLSRRQTLERAPELERWTSQFNCAIASSTDTVADARDFTLALANKLCSQGVRQHYGHKVMELQTETVGVNIVTAKRELAVDAVVICAGNNSTALLRPHGISRPLLPITGYSLTLPKGNDCPDLSVTAMAERLVFAPLESDVRIAGFADIHPTSAGRALRLRELLAVAREIAPNAAGYASEESGDWVGHRPSTPDGLPRIGATGLPGVFENIGHGALGWTLAAATAELVTDAIESA